VAEITKTMHIGIGGFMRCGGVSNILIADTFTDTDAIRLGSHTMNKGTGWVEETGNWEISSNSVKQTTTGGAVYRAITQVGIADMDITYTVNFAGLNFWSGAYFRFADTTHTWRMNVSRDGGGTPYLNVLCDGVDMAGTVLLGVGFIGLHTFRIYLKGSIVRIYVDAVLKYEKLDSALNLTATKFGLATYMDGTWGETLFDSLNAIIAV
jgi:hypothetical protein